MTREEAIKIVKEFINGTCLHLVDQEALETLIPELRESEDEKIRKWLYDYISNCPNNNFAFYGGVGKDAVLNYLEKQKEANKAMEAVDRIDKYINEHVANAHDMADTNPMKKYYEGVDATLSSISGILQDAYEGKQKEQKDYRKLYEDIAKTEWFKKAYVGKSLGEEDEQKEQKHYWKPTETDVALFNKAVTTNKALTPAERAQLDIIRSKFGCCRATNCSGIVQKEQKPAEWNEEDEEMLQSIIKDFRAGKVSTIGQEQWLKSLRPSLKPSEEQMEALKECGECKRCVKKLYEQLKKLM